MSNVILYGALMDYGFMICGFVNADTIVTVVARQRATIVEV